MPGSVIAYERAFFAHLTGLLPSIVPVSLLKSHKISRFILDCERETKGLVTKRLGEIYDAIYIDEFQDLSGYDIDLLELFLRSSIQMTIVGDPRQCTYTTNNAPVNTQFLGVNIQAKIDEWRDQELCQTEFNTDNFRCVQGICDFANRLYPEMPQMQSQNTNTTGHDGIFNVSQENIHQYIRDYSPVILRNNIKVDTKAYKAPAMNFGAAKGLEFDRIVIIPTGPIKKFLQKGVILESSESRAKFYVAITRAKQSVAFLT